MAFPARVGRNQCAKAWSILSIASSHLAALHLVRALPAVRGQCDVAGVDSSLSCRGSASLLQQERFREAPTGSLAEMASMQPQAPKTSLVATAAKQPKVPLSSLANLTAEEESPPFEWAQSSETEWKKLPLSLKLKQAISKGSVQSWGSLANGSKTTSGKNATGNPLVGKDMDDPKCTPGHQCGNGSMPMERSICIPLMNGQGTNQCWDVCNTAHRPEDYDIGDGDETFAKQLAQAVRDLRAGKVEQLKCPGVSAGPSTNATTKPSTNKSVNATKTEYLKEQLMAKGREVFEASQIAEKASAKAASLMKAAQDEFEKALDTSNVSALSIAIKLWEETSSAHAEAYLKAGNVSETLKELRSMLDLFNKEGSEKVAQKVKVAKEKEAIAKNMTAVADKKREEAMKAAQKAMNATSDAVKARAEANSSSNNLTKTANEALKAALNTTTAAPLSTQSAAVTTAPPATTAAETTTIAPPANQSVTTVAPPANPP